jgi:hypothetical protein
MRVQLAGRAFIDPFVGMKPSELSFFIRSREPSRPLITLEDFGNRRGLVGNVASWSAKSSAAFHPALDAAIFPDESDVLAYRFNSGTVPVRRMAQQLLLVHAFDHGNGKHIKLLEGTRRSMIEELAAHEHEPVSELTAGGGFVEVESKESYYVQAADLSR